MISYPLNQVYKQHTICNNKWYKTRGLDQSKDHLPQCNQFHMEENLGKVEDTENLGELEDIEDIENQEDKFVDFLSH